jgi:hypothetical protein
MLTDNYHLLKIYTTYTRIILYNIMSSCIILYIKQYMVRIFINF